MSERLEWNFVGNDEISRLLEKMDRNASKLDKVLDALGGSVTRTGVKMAAAEHQVDSLGDTMEKTTVEAKVLGKALNDIDGGNALTAQLTKLRERNALMVKEFDTLKAIAVERNRLRKLENDAEQAAASVAVDGLSLGRRLSTGVSSAMAELPAAVGEYAAPVGLAIVAGASPVIVTGLAGAVAAGLSVGVIGAGIAAQLFTNDKVQSAAAGLGHMMKDDFIYASSAFEKETIGAIKVIRNEWVALQPEVRATMAAAAQLVAPLVEGVDLFVAKMMPGFQHMIEEADPIFNMLGKELPELGQSIGDVFQVIGDNSDEIADGLKDVLNIVELTIDTVGVAIGEFSALHDLWKNTGLGGLSGAALTLMGVKHGANEAAPAVGALNDKLVEQERKAHAAAHAMDELVKADRGMLLATLDMKDALADLPDALAKHGTSLNEDTQNGRDNLRVMQDLIDKADALGDSEEKKALALGKGADAAAAAGARIRDEYISQLIDQAAKLGYNRTELDKLVADMRADDQTRIALYVDYIERYTAAYNANPYAYSSASAAEHRLLPGRAGGGYVDGPGPKGVDSQLRPMARGEYVINDKMVDRVGVGALDALNRGDVSAFQAAAPGPTGAGAGTTLTLHVIHQYPDGRVIVEQVQKLALGNGDRDLEAVFGLAAAA